MKKSQQIVGRNDLLEIYTDGASRGNPGKGSGGFVFLVSGNIIYRDAQYFGDITNNQAEYRALQCALDVALEYTRWKIKVYSDSQIMINQLNKQWRIKDQALKYLYRQTMFAAMAFESVEYLHVSRNNSYISEADRLCNSCLDEKLGLL
ncbi:ribonuclease HI family protein [Candidatus Saccharibacteria bacterium]|nr:ribonuclease HI family protein [Candidatus Saccharibacteria bacterium]MCB9834555.1 ribonuclease HI family protein [Candidatus Nomurabacteria bacterium]